MAWTPSAFRGGSPGSKQEGLCHVTKTPTCQWWKRLETTSPVKDSHSTHSLSCLEKRCWRALSCPSKHRIALLSPSGPAAIAECRILQVQLCGKPTCREKAHSQCRWQVACIVQASRISKSQDPLRLRGSAPAQLLLPFYRAFRQMPSDRVPAVQSQAGSGRDDDKFIVSFSVQFVQRKQTMSTPTRSAWGMSPRHHQKIAQRWAEKPLK